MIFGGESNRLRKVYTDTLPHKYGIGANKDKLVIDWINSIGFKVKFEYDNIDGELEFLDYEKTKQIITVKYLNNIYSTQAVSIEKARLRAVVGIVSQKNKYKYSIGNIINNNIKNIVILNQTKINQHKAYEYKCLICGYIGICEEKFITKCNCPVCSGRIALKGYNSIWDTTPELAKLLLDLQDGYKYKQKSTAKVDWKCPDCGVISNKRIEDVCTNGLSCICGDGISFPEKAFTALCIQLKKLGLIDSFDRQYKPDWAKNKRYDFKVYGKEAIIETHGIQHYNENSNFIQTLKEIQDNDNFKENLALQNINYSYLIIDVRISSIEYFKNSVMNSYLPVYYTFSEFMINWDEIYKYTLSSFKIQTYEMWNSGNHNIYDIAIKLNLNAETIRRYLREGNKYDMCDYNENNNRNYANSQVRKANSKKVICLTTGEVFNSETEASRKYKVDIQSCCVGKSKSAGKLEDGTKLVWQFYQDKTYESEVN